MNSDFAALSAIKRPPLLMSGGDMLRQRAAATAGHALLFSITSIAALGVLFIFWFIARDAVPFFQLRGFREFFSGDQWYPSRNPPEFGAMPIFFGSLLVTAGSIAVAMPLGVVAAVSLSDVLPFSARQLIKPVIEMLAAIPSVAYGFFALVVLAPLLQDQGGKILSLAWWLIASPVLGLSSLLLSEVAARRFSSGERGSAVARAIFLALLGGVSLFLLASIGSSLVAVRINSGANALNVSIILGIMALPTVVSMSEDALQAVGRELREGSYALGATRCETMLRVVIPAAGSGILAAVLLGVMRAMGETMVVWMASGNAARVPEPWFNLLQPVRTLTATIAGDMGEADHVTGSARYHVLFAMGLSLLAICFVCNFVSEWFLIKQRRRLKGA